jgi:hypothetical protein
MSWNYLGGMTPLMSRPLFEAFVSSAVFTLMLGQDTDLQSVDRWQLVKDCAMEIIERTTKGGE